jgi:transglycosylase-like protein
MLRRSVVGALILLTAFVAFRVLAGSLERRITASITARIATEAARLGARARVGRVRLSLLPPLRLSEVVVEKPGQWEARFDDVSVSFRPWGRSGLGAFERVSIGAATLRLPAGLELQLNPSLWEVSSQSGAELQAPVEGLTLSASAGSSGGVYDLRASQLPMGRLGRLLVEGAAAPDLGILDGEAHGEGSLGQSFAVRWRFASIGAETTGKAIVSRGSGDARLQLELKLERLDLTRLFRALGIELPAGAEALGSVSVVVGAAGPLAEPASLVITQRIDFTPPAKAPPALARLREDFAHEVTALDGTRQTIDVSPEAPGFIARADIPPLFVQTLLLGEDAAFFSHRGLDLGELPIALAANWAQGSAIRGASTITQQLAKNLFLSREKSLHRKLQELALAFLLESTLGKDRILEIYVNVIEWGPGLYGLRPAARHYFGKEPRALTPKEMAFLVALIPGPIKYQRSFEGGSLSPGFEPLVTNLLVKLRSTNALSEEEYAAALAQTLAFRRADPLPPGRETGPPVGQVARPPFEQRPRHQDREALEREHDPVVRLLRSLQRAGADLPDRIFRLEEPLRVRGGRVVRGQERLQRRGERGQTGDRPLVVVQVGLGHVEPDRAVVVRIAGP